MGKLRGEKDIEATIQRLDRLTLDEGRATTAQTLEVVCGLVQQKRAIMDGENVPSPELFSLPAESSCLDADGNESGASISRALGMFMMTGGNGGDRITDRMIESMQEIVSKLNKAERRFIPMPDVHIDGQEY